MLFHRKKIERGEHIWQGMFPKMTKHYLSNSTSELMILSAWRTFQQTTTMVSPMGTHSIRLTFIQVENSTQGTMFMTELW